MQDEIRIPRARVGVVVGREGETKKKLESLFDCKITVSSDGHVAIEGDDGLNVWKAKKAVLAMSRGFSFEDASCLKSDDCELEVINLKDVLGKSDKRVRQYKARIIGTGGKVKEEIEQRTGAKLAVRGKTVAVLGKHEDISKARQAVDMILRGSEISTVYKHIDRGERSA